MKSYKTYPLLLCCFFLWKSLLLAQSAFLDEVQLPYSHGGQVVETENGGLMIACSFKTDPDQFYFDGSQIVVYNDCGQLERTIQYTHPGYFMEVNQILKSTDGYYYLMGRHFETVNNRNFFLLKLDAYGNEIFFHVYSRPYHEYVYTLDETPNGELMVFGTSYLNTSGGRNFFMRLDQEGNIQFSQLYFLSGIWGFGLACEDGGSIGRMGRRTYKIDAAGNLLWANSYNEIRVSSALVEVEGGYIGVSFRQSGGQDFRFLYKLDEDGDILWTSESFHGGGRPLLKQAANGDLLCLDYYEGESSGEKEGLSLLVFSSEGEQRSNHLLRSASGTENNHKDFTILSDGSIAFVSHAGPGEEQLWLGKTDALYQLNCENEFIENKDTAITVTYESVSTDVLPVEFEVVKDYSLVVEEVENTSSRLCDERDWDFPPPQNDTTICDGDEFILDFSLDGAYYEWQDQSNEPTFLVKDGGLHSVTIEKCGITETREVMVTLEDCPCQIELPNAFTPNGDGRNDIFKAIYDCFLFDFRLSVYDRWGHLIFETNDPEIGWEGFIEGNAAPSAVYIYRYQYRSGRRADKSLEVKVGDVSLIR